MKKITNIVILAGGDGDRFWPFRNKCTIPFLGKPFLNVLIDGLSPYAERIFVVGNPLNREPVEQMITGRAAFILQEDGSQGMAGAVLACRDHVRGDTLVIGNDYIDFTVLEKIVDKAATEGAAMVFLAKKTTSYFPGGYLELKDGKVAGIIEKPQPDKTPSDLIRLVVDYFRDFDDFVAITEKTATDRDDRYEQGMNEYIHMGKAAYVVYDGYWQALKYPWHILQMDRIMRGLLKSPQIDESTYISDNAVIEGDVVIRKGCKIGNFVKIAGPCYIGEGTIIGDYSLIRDSSIGAHALIGSGCEVARSYLSDNVSLHRNYVGDSVLGKDILFGAGAVTANFRFDQKSVQSAVGGTRIDTGLYKLGAMIGERAKVGVNTTLFPGVKIGSGSMVAPGEAIAQDISDGMYVTRGVLKPNKL